jgi:acyl-ACP thioesterase
MNAYIENFKVAGFQTGPNGNLTIRSLCNFLYEAAGNHCIEHNITVSELQDIGLTWMLSRIHIEIKRLPVYRESISVKTWPTGARGLFSCRDFLVENESGEELVKATSAWLTINLEKRRVVRLPEEILRIHPNLSSSERVLIDDFKSKLAEPSGDDIYNGFRASYSTLDLNNHVTAPVYVDWMFDALPAELIESEKIVSLELNYKQEILPGGTAFVKHEIRDSGDCFEIIHSVNDADNGIVNCLAKSRWKKNGL